MRADRFKINAASVISETIEGEAVIINLRTGYYYSLSGSGAEIWDAIAKQLPAPQIVQDLSARYTERSDDIAAIIDEFLSELLKEDLVVPIASDDPATPQATLASGTARVSPSFVKPTLSRFDDMQDLLLLDPLPKPDEKGWPNPQQ